MKLRASRLAPLTLVLSLWISLPAAPQETRKITTPKEAFGFNIGDDYHLANYEQLVSYWQTLARESDRMKLVDIGPTAEGRRQYMAIISSPENIANLEEYKQISSRLARAEGLTDDEAMALAQKGRSVVWIDGGLHASETVGAQQLIETVYELNSLTDAETTRFLHDDIALCVLANPDGLDLVANWYMREPTPDKRTFDGYTGGLPRLWQKYIGHDNNRDFYMNNMPETTNMSRVLFREWYPQVMYNHHQTGPLGAVIFMPPFRDPANYNYDPLITLKIQAVGTAMHERLVEEGKPGSGMRSAANYSTWYNGGLRTVTYFHNMTGILTEIIGSPTPMQLPLVPARQLPTGDLPFPVPPQTWHFSQSIAYEQTNNRAILDYASREREHLLYDMYRMGKNSIDRGSRDNWTITPKRITALEAAAAEVKPSGKTAPLAPSFDSAKTAPAELYQTVLHDPAKRDPRGFILPEDQPDFPTATKFVNALLKSGVEIEQATADFEVAGKHYPAGSYVVMTAQAFRPQVMDLFEPQDHPNDFAYPGGPPVRPYDATGWTLAYQMGVRFDRELEPFTGPFARITTELAKPLPGKITGPGKPAGYLVSHEYNDAFTLTNRLLKANQQVYWLAGAVNADGKTLAAGALWLPYSAETKSLLDRATQELGINACAVTKRPAGQALLLHPARIALYDQYGGLIPSGWLRWLFEQFEFPYTVVYPQTLDAGDLNSKFDDIVFSDGAITSPGRDSLAGARLLSLQPKPETIPAEYRGWLGAITPEKTIPQLQSFVDNGGTILAIGSSTRLYEDLHLPLRNAVTEVVKGKEQAVSPERFYIPGSLMRAQVNTASPVGYGMPSSVDVFFDRSPAFLANPDAALKGVTTIAWYGGGKLLDSGWAWGETYLNNSIAVAQANVGKGKVLLYGPEVTFRGQPHSTFKLLFNGLLYGPATDQNLK
ncbi:MAG TPA: M14 metallopeptidase family protein [Acidobacteriaceae bacterium]|nr:M14 metallopeptidase family protein [Acidobacteriaceae bacterium]